MERYPTQPDRRAETEGQGRAEDRSKKRQEIFSDSSLDRSQMREKMQPIMEEQNKKLKAILTEDQFKQVPGNDRSAVRRWQEESRTPAQ